MKLEFRINRLTHCFLFFFFSIFVIDAQQLVGYHGYHQAGAQPQQRQRSRMRTVFTDGQTKRLEALFELTDYPTVEARADVARSTGLSEETVRVSFPDDSLKCLLGWRNTNLPPLMELRKTSPGGILRMTRRLTMEVYFVFLANQFCLFFLKGK